jgi:hypothetical protein
MDPEKTLPPKKFNRKNASPKKFDPKKTLPAQWVDLEKTLPRKNGIPS